MHPTLVLQQTVWPLVQGLGPQGHSPRLNPVSITLFSLWSTPYPTPSCGCHAWHSTGNILQVATSHSEHTLISISLVKHRIFTAVSS